MKILFISYSAVSLRRGSVRTVAMLRALADAGHRVDVIAPEVDLSEHPQLSILMAHRDRPFSRNRLRHAAYRIIGRGAYDALHAVDEAVFFARRLSRWKKIPLAYDAVRRFGGVKGCGGTFCWKWFPRHFARLEQRVLEQARLVLSPCSVLTADLAAVCADVSVAQVEDMPVQPLLAGGAEVDGLFSAVGGRPRNLVVCTVSDADPRRSRSLLMAARKVYEAMPDVIFYFRGLSGEHAEKMAANLDLHERCVFLAPDDLETYVAVLDQANASLIMSSEQSRYLDPQVYTLLSAASPVVAVQHAAAENLLNEKTCVSVLPEADAMAEGLLRVLQEPLFSLAVATEGQQLVAEGYSYSSFKHKVRMNYHKLFKKG